MKLMQRNNALPYWILVIIYAYLIFILSSIPKPPEPSQMLGLHIPYSDKIEHFFLYGVFGILIYMASLRTDDLENKEISSFALGIFYAFTDEIHQHFVPGRSCDPWDFITDAIGIVAGIVFYLWKWRKV
jgi:VanZ family protein